MNINEPNQRGLFELPFLRRKRPSGRPHSVKSNRLPLLGLLPDNARNHFVATSAEYAGTTLFLLFAFAGTSVALAGPDADNNYVGAVADTSSLMYISLCFGFSLAVNAWVFFRISGGLFNPAVTLGMCLVGALPWLRGLFLFIAQVLGGITAAAITSALLPGPLKVRTNLSGGTSIAQGLFIEMFLTAELVFTIFMLAAEKHKGTFIAPIGIGLSLFIAELMGVYYTGGSVNPARSFGPSVVSHEFHGYHWIYWVGPILGALLASGFYKFIKMLEYETANPAQDADRVGGEHFNPDADRSSARVAFHPDEYAMEEGRAGRVSSSNTAVGGTPLNIGVPKEYGSAPRPYMDSPAPPNPNDGFTGLAPGGMHGDEFIKSSEASDVTLGGGTGLEPLNDPVSEPTLGGGVGSVPLNESEKLPEVGAGGAAVGGNLATTETQQSKKGALRNAGLGASRNGTYSNGGNTHGVNSNTYANKALGSDSAY